MRLHLKTLCPAIMLLLSCFSSFAHRRSPADSLYKQFFSRKECSEEAFRLAWQGYLNLRADSLLSSPQYLSIVDFSRPSNKRRFFVLDVRRHRLLLSSITAHGLGSDPDSIGIPYRFSNTEGSRMSSVGFYLTGSTYTNHRPCDSLGLCLFGLDAGFNDSAASREIVLHYGASEKSGSVYVTDSGAARSFGCPALPLSTNARIIQTIKGGSVLFIFSGKDLQRYKAGSTVLNRKLRLPIVQQGPPPNSCSCNISKIAH